jgi:hypothetical protein
MVLGATRDVSDRVGPSRDNCRPRAVRVKRHFTTAACVFFPPPMDPSEVRKMRNRQSARRHRNRLLARLGWLEHEVARLRGENASLRRRVDFVGADWSEDANGTWLLDLPLL